MWFISESEEGGGVLWQTVPIPQISRKQAKRWFSLLLTLHVLTQIIASSEFAGMNFQEHLLENLIRKLVRKYGQGWMESEFLKPVLCCCSWILSSMSDQRTEASCDHSKFLLGQLDYFGFGLHVWKPQIPSITLQIILNCGKIPKWKMGGKPYLLAINLFTQL